ncbi:MAG: hypothetical protein WBS24_18425 [Terriglobales bacterium]
MLKSCEIHVDLQSSPMSVQQNEAQQKKVEQNEVEQNMVCPGPSSWRDNIRAQRKIG